MSSSATAKQCHLLQLKNAVVSLSRGRGVKHIHNHPLQSGSLKNHSDMVISLISGFHKGESGILFLVFSLRRNCSFIIDLHKKCFRKTQVDEQVQEKIS